MIFKSLNCKANCRTSHTLPPPSITSHLDPHESHPPSISPQKPHAVFDWAGESVPLTDVLHRRVRRPQKCGSKCLGSTMDHQGVQSNKPPPLEEMLVQAADFMADYYRDNENHGETVVE